MVKTYLLIMISKFRHKKSLNQTQRSPTLSRKVSVCRDNDDLSADIVHVEEETPEELRLTHRMVDKFLKISGDVAGKDCIVVDDMIDTGSTIRLALEVLHSHNSG